MYRSYITVAAGIFYLGAVDCCLADSFTFDLRATGRLEFPAWIPDRPLAYPKSQAELAFPVVPGADDDEDSGQRDQIMSLGVQALSTSLAASGGIGIGKMIAKSLHATAEKQQAAETPAAASEASKIAK